MFPYFSSLIQAEESPSSSLSQSNFNSLVSVASRSKLRILVLYDHYSTHIKTVQDHVRSFGEYSRHSVFYSPATRNVLINFELELFDVIIIHYSVRMAFDWHMSPHFRAAVASFEGLKVLFIQDEYDHTWQSSRMITELGIRLVFSCVPQVHVRQIYSKVDPNVEFFNVLTGYLPIDPPILAPRPIAERPILIGYRGRRGLDRYGDLAREKFMIGVKMREICDRRGVPCDIEWDEEKRIYGDDWFRFLCDCKVTLGAESGSNVFDFDGALDRTLKTVLEGNPSIPYEEIHEKYLAPLEQPDLMNQVSPRIFESIMAKSALVLFEGKYSGVLQANTHYIPLRKDFANIDDVLAKIRDDRYLQRLADAAYEHVIGSGDYTYSRFVGQVDRLIESRAKKRAEVGRFITTVVAVKGQGGESVPLQNSSIFTEPIGQSLMKSMSAMQSTAIDPMQCEFRIGTNPTNYSSMDDANVSSLFVVPTGPGKISFFNNEAAVWISHTREKALEIPLVDLQSNCNYDVFAYLYKNELEVQLVPWSSNNARKIQISRIQGILVQSDQGSHRYLGTFRTNDHALVTDNPATRSIWNYHNRLARPMLRSVAGDHALDSHEWRLWNADPNANIEFLVGYVEEPVTLTLGANIYGGDGMIAMGINAEVGFSPTIRNANTYILEGSVSRVEVPALGLNRVNICEYGGPGYRSSMAILSGIIRG